MSLSYLHLSSNNKDCKQVIKEKERGGKIVWLKEQHLWASLPEKKHTSDVEDVGTIHFTDEEKNVQNVDILTQNWENTSG